MLQRKWYWLIIIIVCFILTGCNKKDDEKAQTVLTFTWWGDEGVHRATLEAVKEYERLHPEIKIETDFWEEEAYFQRIYTQLANDKAPDIFQFNSAWYDRIRYWSASKPCNLEKLNIDFTGVEDFLDENRSEDGEIIVYPLSQNGQCLIINCDFFQRYDISQDTCFTWESMMEEGKRIHSICRTEYLLQASADEMGNILIPAYLVQQTGKSMVSDSGSLQFTIRNLTETLEAMVLLNETDTVVKYSKEMQVLGNSDENGKWAAGKVGIRLGSIHDYVEIKKNANFPVAALPLPRLEGSNYSGVDYQAHIGLAINENTPYPEEAADFLQWFVSSEEAAEKLGLSRGIPANEKIRHYLIGKTVIEEELLAIESMMKEDSYAMNWKSGDRKFARLCKRALISILDGKLEPEDAAMEVMIEWLEQR